MSQYNAQSETINIDTRNLFAQNDRHTPVNLRYLSLSHRDKAI